MKITKHALFFFITMNKTALAGNEAHLSIIFKVVSSNNNTKLDMRLHFPLHIVKHGR